jgi:tetratricopeptide (TPR) repeat protein
MRCLVLGVAAIALYGQNQSPPAAPQYFDEPNFIVAGVTDPSERGGHGSDPVFRSAEALAKDTASLRTNSSAADAEESQGNVLGAARKYQRAAELYPTEDNLFNWGTELLKHQAAEQASEIFAKGHRLFPQSKRTLLGLAVALYSRGSYDEAARRFFEAADLDPSDPAPYLFLGKVSSATILDTAGFTERMERFARLDPGNSWANYYYAATLWRNKSPDDTAAAQKVRTLLKKAVRLDPKLGDAFMLLGTVFADQNNLNGAIASYQSAIQANPSLEEAHYRLALAYRRMGDQAKAKEEIDVYQKLSRQSAQKAEHDRDEIQQFVFKMRR